MTNGINIKWIGAGYEKQQLCRNHRQLRIRSYSQNLEQAATPSTERCDVIIVGDSVDCAVVELFVQQIGTKSGIVLLDSPYDFASAIDQVRRGIFGHLAPGHDPRDLCRAVRAAACRSFWYDRTILERNVNQQESTLAALSARERQAVELIKAGATNVEIGLAMQISPHTVKSHIRCAMSKLGVRSRVQLALIAHDIQHNFSEPARDSRRVVG